MEVKLTADRKLIGLYEEILKEILEYFKLRNAEIRRKSHKSD